MEFPLIKIIKKWQLDELKKDVVYHSSNPKIASVDTGGNVTALKTGTTTITAEIDGLGLSSTCEIEVTPGKPVESVSLAVDSIIVQSNSNVLIDYEVYPADATNKNVTWYSSDDSICTVNEFGTISILSQGVATVTVKTNDGGYTDSCTIVVQGNTACVQRVVSNSITKYRTFMYGDIATQIWNFDDQKQAIAAIGVYDDSGRLIHMQEETINLTTGDNSKEFAIDIDGINKNKAYDIKVFLWQDLNSLIALSEEKTIRINNN